MQSPARPFGPTRQLPKPETSVDCVPGVALVSDYLRRKSEEMWKRFFAALEANPEKEFLAASRLVGASIQGVWHA